MHINQADLLVAVQARAVGKAGEQFVAPCAGEPCFGGRIGEFFELPAHIAHIRWAAKYDGIGLVQCVPILLGDIAFFVNLDQLRLCGCSQSLGDALGMTVAGMIYNNNLCHDGLLVWVREEFQILFGK